MVECDLVMFCGSFGECHGKYSQVCKQKYFTKVPT